MSRRPALAPVVVLVAAVLAATGAVLAVGTIRQSAPARPRPDPAPTARCLAPAADAAAGHTHALANAPPPRGGLVPSADGFTLRLDRSDLSAGNDTAVRLQVLDRAGAPARLVPGGGVALHAYLVSSTLEEYQHLHPVPDARCGWQLTASAPRPGRYRLFAVFQPQGRPPSSADVVLSRPVTVTGVTSGPGRAAPTAAVTSTTVDGYRLQLRGYVTPGSESLLSVLVSRDGRPVRTLRPYLGAMAHVSVFRAGDLAFTHAHPVQPLSSAGGPTLTLPMILPGAGAYRLFVQFNADGAVRTAGFTIIAR